MPENKLGITDIVETQNAWDDFCEKIESILEDGDMDSGEAVAAYMKMKKFKNEVSDIKEMHEQIDDADPSELRQIGHGLVDNVYNGYNAGAKLLPYLKEKFSWLLRFIGI